MEIEVLYIPGCPHRELARRNVELALAHLNRAAALWEREIASTEEADRLGMRGSPTILVDGHDLFAGPAADAGLSCRLYPGTDGMSGAPTVSQLVEAMGG